jgi:hypothetical protein
MPPTLGRGSFSWSCVTVGALTVAGVTVYHKIAEEENLNQQ